MDHEVYRIVLELDTLSLLSYRFAVIFFNGLGSERKQSGQTGTNRNLQADELIDDHSDLYIINPIDCCGIATFKITIEI